jgi:hypothetical protein
VEHADLVLTGGAVRTMDASRPLAEAVAVAGGRVLAVGDARGVRDLAGPRTRVVELEGRSVLPGFQDAHIHPATGGLAMLGCALFDATTREECLAAVARYAAEHPDRDWIVGDGWSLDSFPGGVPLAADLDAVAGGRPVYLENRDGHTAWASSRALELAGIGPGTPDPPGGRIERGPCGEPLGALHEDAMRLVARLLPPPTPADWERAILLAQAEAHRLGLTAWQEAKVVPETLAAYRALAERGELTIRTEGNLHLSHERGDDALEELLELRSQGTVGRLRLRGAKLFQDGVLETRTGAVLEPYRGRDGHPTGETGLSLFEPERLKQVVTALDAHGFQVHVHAIGDRAVRETLDALEAARAVNGARDARHHLCHLQLVHPADRPRFRALGVVANCQPLWACHSGYVDELTIPFLSEEAARTMYPFGSLHRAGARLAFGSDWTVSTQNPLPQIEVAATRVHPETRDHEPLLADERLDLATAVEAFTLGSAYVNHLDGVTGTIEPGKLADLVVLDRDLFDPAAGLPADARVLLTLVEGEQVWEDPALGA